MGNIHQNLNCCSSTARCIRTLKCCCHLVHGVQERHHLGRSIPKFTEYGGVVSISVRMASVGKLPIEESVWLNVQEMCTVIWQARAACGQCYLQELHSIVFQSKRNEGSKAMDYPKQNVRVFEALNRG